MSTDRRQRRAGELIALFDRAPIKRTFGMSLSYDERFHACFDLPHAPGLDHALHDIHGGVLATLLDNAGWFAVAIDHDTWIVTVEFHVRLLEPPRRAHLRSEGWVVRAGQRLSVAEMKVTADDGRLVATGSGTFAVTSGATAP